MLGQNISSTEIDLMSEQQLGQLLELKTETAKPRGGTNKHLNT